MPIQRHASHVWRSHRIPRITVATAPSRDGEQVSCRTKTLRESSHRFESKYQNVGDAEVGATHPERLQPGAQREQAEQQRCGKRPHESVGELHAKAADRIDDRRRNRLCEGEIQGRRAEPPLNQKKRWHRVCHRFA
jgi:hypothetical protein